MRMMQDRQLSDFPSSFPQHPWQCRLVLWYARHRAQFIPQGATRLGSMTLGSVRVIALLVAFALVNPSGNELDDSDQRSQASLGSDKGLSEGLMNGRLQSEVMDSDRGWEQVECRCETCNTYDLRGLWKCECEALNVSKNNACWRCERPRPLATEGDSQIK